MGVWMKWSKLFVSLTMTLFLVACSGTGTRDFSEVSPLIAQAGKGKVFVHRDTGLQGVAIRIHVNLNGKLIGKIADGEVIVGSAKQGANRLEAKFPGISGVGVNTATANFNNTSGANKFYVIKLEWKIVTSELVLQEMTETTWKRWVNY